jgi:predicted lactoylglutathione lyase
LGIEANFGVANLNKIGQDYSGDREVMQKMMMFQRVAQQAVVLSTMSDEQIAAAEAEEKAKQEKARQQQQAMQERGRQVQLAVSSMSQEEKDKVKEKMNAKWTTLMRLPQQDKMTYMSRLPDHDQIDFAMMSAIMMQEKMEVAALASAGRTAAGAGGGGRRDVAVTPTDKNN